MNVLHSQDLLRSQLRTSLVFVGTLASGVAFSHLVSAEVANGSVNPRIDDMEEVVITGTRTEKALADTPVRTEVVTRKEIELKHAQDLKQAIEGVPGVMLKKIHGKTGYEAWLQGVSSDRVLVLVNGEPVAKSTGSTADLTQIGMAGVARVEIVKGATSALYGSAAMGGVINVITDQPKAGWHYDAQVQGGGYSGRQQDGHATEVGGSSASGSLSGKKGSVSGDMFFDVRATEGYSLTPGSWDQQGPEGQKQNVGGTLVVDVAPVTGNRVQGELSVHAAQYDEDTSSRYSTNAGGKSIRYRKTERATTQRARLGSKVDLSEAADLAIQLLHETFDDTTSQDAVATPFSDQQRTAEMQTRKASAQWNQAVGSAHLLTFGAEYFSESLAQTRVKASAEGQRSRITEIDAGSERSNHVLYFQDDYLLTDSVELLPGFRYQYDSDFGGYFAPKVNGRWDLPGTAWMTPFLRFGVGRGYRVPNLKERYYVFDHSHLGYMVLGNPDLAPETSNSYQLGWGAEMAQQVNLDVTLFYNRLKGLIVTRTDDVASAQQGLLINRYANIDSARTAGVELAVAQQHADVPLLNAWLDFSAGYTWLDSEDLSTGKTLNRRPEHQLKVNMTLHPNPTLMTLSVYATWQSKEFYDVANTVESPSYSTFDIKVNYPWQHGITLFGGVDNLGDVQKDAGNPQDLRPEDGRYFYAGIRISS